jgi:hypothetical protein
MAEDGFQSLTSFENPRVCWAKEFAEPLAQRDENRKTISRLESRADTWHNLSQRLGRFIGLAK